MAGESVLYDGALHQSSTELDLYAAHAESRDICDDLRVVEESVLGLYQIKSKKGLREFIFHLPKGFPTHAEGLGTGIASVCIWCFTVLNWWHQVARPILPVFRVYHRVGNVKSSM